MMCNDEIETFVQNFAKRMKQLRLDNGFTEEAVADKLKMTKETYIRYETCKKDVRFSLICDLAEVYDILPSELLKGL